MDGDARLRRGLVERGDEARPAAPGLDRQPAPEAEAAVFLLEGLAAVTRLEAHAVLAQPEQGGVAAGHELLDQVGVGAVLGQARHVVVIVCFGVGAEIGLRQLTAGEIGHQRAERIDAVEDHPHGAGGIGAIAAPLFLGRGFEQAHASAGLGRGERCRERGVAAAHDHDIGCQRLGHPTLAVLGCVAVAAHSAGGASGMPAAAIRPIETWGSRLLPRSFPTAAVDTGSADVVSCQHASGKASEEGGRECLTRCRKWRLDGDADTIRASLGRDEMRRGGSFRLSDINLVHAPQHRQPRQAIATLHRSLLAYVG